MDLALLSVLRDGLLRRSEAAALTWGDVELRENGSALINVRRSKTDPEAEGVTLYIGPQAGQALQGHQAGRGAVGPKHAGLRVVTPADRPESRCRSPGRGPGRRLHRPQRPRGHGPGPGQDRRRIASADDRRTVEEFHNAGAVHRTSGRRPGRGGQVLPGGRGLETTRHQPMTTVTK